MNTIEGAKLLLIEDEFNLGEITKYLLENSGIEVRWETSGEEGLKALKEYSPDIILCDIMMKGIDGYEVLRQIKQKERFTFTPFIFLSAKASPSEIKDGIRMGANDYVVKPFRIENLKETIELRYNQSQELKSYRNKAKETSSMNNFMVRASHEFNTPLHGIKGCIEFLKNDIDNLNQSEIINLIAMMEYSHQRLERTILNMITAIEVSNNPHEFEINGKTKIDDIINSEYEYLQKKYSRNNEPNIKTEKNIPFVQISEKLANKIIHEIIDNACKFSQIDEEIFISCSFDNKYVCVSISNFGEPFTEENIRSIDMFQQFNRDINEQQGLGLGLYLSNAILTQNHGFLKIFSENGLNTVKLYFPILC